MHKIITNLGFLVWDVTQILNYKYTLITQVSRYFLIYLYILVYINNPFN